MNLYPSLRAALAASVLFSTFAACDNSGSDESPASARQASETRRYRCERIDNNQSAAEAQPVFTLDVKGPTQVTLRGVDIADECTGKKAKTAKKLAAQFQKYAVGGAECAADGFDAFVEHALFAGVERGLALVEANESTDYYLCTATRGR